MQETIYVGLDLGSSVCQQTVLSGDGERRFSRVIATSEKSLRTAFDKLGGDVRVHMEAGELAGWVGSILKPMVAEVIVSHPRSLRISPVHWIGRRRSIFKPTTRYDHRPPRKIGESQKADWDSRTSSITEHASLQIGNIGRYSGSFHVLSQPNRNAIRRWLTFSPFAASFCFYLRQACRTLCLTAAFIADLLGGVFS